MITKAYGSTPEHIYRGGNPASKESTESAPNAEIGFDVEGQWLYKRMLE